MGELDNLSFVMRSLWGGLLDTEGMVGTPERVLRHWKEITSGLNEDPSEPLRKTFPCSHDQIVVEKDLAFNSLCEHHLLPFFGVAHVGYIPNGRVVGLSKIPRALDRVYRVAKGKIVFLH
jgi:GTP cyclohydrolase I